LAERDARDTVRAAAPLKPAPDAVIIDTSHITADEAVHAVLNLYGNATKLSI